MTGHFLTALAITLTLAGCSELFVPTAPPVTTETDCTGGSSTNVTGAPAAGGDGKDAAGNPEPLVGGGTAGTGGSCTTKTKIGETIAE